MKKLNISWQLAFCLFLLLSNVQKGEAQFLKRLEDKVTNSAENQIDDAADKAIDQTEHPGSDQKKGTDVDSPDQTTAINGNSAPSIKSYQNYDFVPGDTVIFYDDFSGDQDGEFPSHWNLSKGQAVVNQITGKPAFCLTEGNYFQVTPRMKTESYLTDPFTIEFDTYCDENNSAQGSPILFLTYMDKDGNSSEGEIQFNKGDLGGRGDVSLAYFPNDLSNDLPEALRASYPNNWHHCAIIYKDNQLKCYVDQYRILAVPNLNCVPTAFGFEGVGDEDHPTVITNVRAASGGNMNMVGKKFTESKIITHGITFDVDKSDIKPQSMGTLNMIVGVLKSNPDLKFEIDGYTDNTGQPAHNLTLSEQRANAVKAQLIKMGISTSRLTSKGFGDSNPISDNSTPQGKANNRRVEFVKV